MYHIGNESFMWPLGANKRLCWVIEARAFVEVKVLFYGSCLIEAGVPSCFVSAQLLTPPGVPQPLFQASVTLVGRC